MCTECLSEELNPHSTSLCRDCQIKWQMWFLEDYENTINRLQRDIIEYKQYTIELDRQLQGKQNATIQSEQND